jgi:hypothetical protein
MNNARLSKSSSLKKGKLLPPHCLGNGRSCPLPAALVAPEPLVEQLAFLTMTNIRRFCVASNSREPMQTIKTMWKAIFQNKLTIHSQSKFTIIRPKNYKKSLLCAGLISHWLRLKSHPKMAAWERLISEHHLLRDSTASAKRKENT